MSSGQLSLVALPEQQRFAAADTSFQGQLTHLTQSSIDLPADLSRLTIRALRALCDDLYKALDADYPPYGAGEDYSTAVEELGRRQAKAAERGVAADAREKFRDNPLRSQFELYRDGTVVGYLKYVMRAGRITLLATIVEASYPGAKVEETLIGQALLSIHRRRLAPTPYCPYVQAFLAANPQFLALMPTQRQTPENHPNSRRRR
ncbi:GNAT family N-acetyltransferase [Arthrobacter sp. TmT3-37]